MNVRGRISFPRLLKSYYSIGAMLYSIVLPALAGGTWWVLTRLAPAVFGHEWVGLICCIICSYAVAFFVPEPIDSADGGKLILTKEEAITAFFGGILTFMIVLGAQCLVNFPSAH